MVLKKKISILGCGWFGFPLGKSLVKKGYKVLGSTTTPQKLLLLKAQGIDSYLLQLPPTINKPSDQFFKSDILIITIPPRSPDYLNQITQLKDLLILHGTKRVIFISSTSVYENDNREIDETTPAMPESASGNLMRSAEELLLTSEEFKTTIIRFSGLIGPGRHPARFLAGKVNIPNGRAPVNLIHLDDCIGIIEAVIEKDMFGKIFNGVCPDHPTRKEFYTLASKLKENVEPLFIDELLDWKIVKSSEILPHLNYQFKIKDLSQWLHSALAND